MCHHLLPCCYVAHCAVGESILFSTVQFGLTAVSPVSWALTLISAALDYFDDGFWCRNRSRCVITGNHWPPSSFQPNSSYGRCDSTTVSKCHTYPWKFVLMMVSRRSGTLDIQVSFSIKELFKISPRAAAESSLYFPFQTFFYWLLSCLQLW